MPANHGLMRSLGPEDLKPRPSTQAVWVPRDAAAQPQEKAAPVAVPEPETVLPQMPVTYDPPSEPEPAPQPLQEPRAEEMARETQPERPEEVVVPSYSEAIFTFAPVCGAVPEEEEPEAESEPEYSETEYPSMEETDADEEPFDLDAVIASILAQDDEDEEEEDTPAAQDAVATEEMPRPASVPLYDAPAPRPRRGRWLWLVGAALAAVAAGFAARRLGWLN